MAKLHLSVRPERWQLRNPFRIANRTWREIETVFVTIEDEDGWVGHGEAMGVHYNGETLGSMLDTIMGVAGTVETGISREELRQLLPVGGARNAIDCALWDLEAKSQGCAAWEIAGLQPPRPLITTFTCGADSPEAMARSALDYAGARALKLKLTGEPIDVDRVTAVRGVCPEVWLGVDANRGFSRSNLDDFLARTGHLQIALLEQPFPIGDEALLEGLRSPIPIAADESIQGIDDLEKLNGCFDVVNIKLDKCGGLTEGLMLARRAHEYGLTPMVGNMLGTSLAMAPAFLVGQLCEVIDLDGPLFLTDDRLETVIYDKGRVDVPHSLWGGNSSASQ
jgi:L-Ala-D/L-Glu epimerase / N-acetyl-D-glutamate racemase